jgi:hypothetical protein
VSLHAYAAQQIKRVTRITPLPLTHRRGQIREISNKRNR